MKSLPTLIKLAQRNIDMIAVEIAKSQAHIEELRMQKASAQAKMDVEQAMAEDELDLNMLGSMPAYIARQKWENERIEAKIAEIEQSIAHVRERLILAYQEKSKLENLEAKYDFKAKQDLNTREQSQLDEAALTRRA